MNHVYGHLVPRVARALRSAGGRQKTRSPYMKNLPPPVGSSYMIPQYTRRKTAQKESIYRYTIGIIYEVPTTTRRQRADQRTRGL